KHVLILYSDDRLLPASIITDERIRSAFQYRPGRTFQVQYFSEFLDVTHFSGNAYETQVETFLRNNYARYPLDLIIANAPQALEFLLHHRAHLFAGIPIEFLSTPTPISERLGQDKGVTGVRVNYSIFLAPTLELAMRLQPAARHVVVVAGSMGYT